MAKPVRYYKIRDTNTGLFFKPGYVPSWSKKGRVWSSLGFVCTSLKSLRAPLKGVTFLKDWEIVEFELAEISTKSVNNAMDEFQARSAYLKEKKNERRRRES